METADRILLVVDGSLNPPNEDDADAIWPERAERLSRDIPVTIVHNKCDLSGKTPGIYEQGEATIIELSAKTGAGMPLLQSHLKTCMGFDGSGESRFSARRRHLQSLGSAAAALERGRFQLMNSGAGELLAEDLRQCHEALGEITGAMSSDALLGEIFSSFCIGK
jgi:tRNA modification GTPase